MIRILAPLLVPLLAWLFVPPDTLYGQAGGPGTQRPQEVEALTTAAPPVGVQYQSEGRRDPFLNPLLLKKREDDSNAELTRGEPPPGISGMYIEQVVLLGTSLNEGNYTAVFRGTDKRAYFLRIGDRLFDGYIQSIEGDSVVLIRETHLRSGKVLTQEVNKRLRLP